MSKVFSAGTEEIFLETLCKMAGRRDGFLYVYNPIRMALLLYFDSNTDWSNTNTKGIMNIYLLDFFYACPWVATAISITLT